MTNTDRIFFRCWAKAARNIADTIEQQNLTTQEAASRLRDILLNRPNEPEGAVLYLLRRFGDLREDLERGRGVADFVRGLADEWERRAAAS